MQIEFATSSYPGQIPQEGAGRCINAMVEKMGDGVKWVRSPGVRRYFATPPADNVTGFRGMGFMNNTLWVAYKDALYQSTTASGGLLTKVPDAGGTTPQFVGTDPVFFAQNMRVTTGGPDMVAARATGGAYTLQVTGVSTYPDANLPVTCRV